MRAGACCQNRQSRSCIRTWLEDGGDWRAARAGIAAELEELTLLWQVGYAKRVAAHARGLRRWRDPACNAAAVGVDGPKYGPTLDAILDINRDGDGPPVRPGRITAEEHAWRTPGGVEFYVDFETVSDLDDDFARIPERGGQALIFMIGCGHIEGGEWRFECFVADSLEEAAEAVVIENWLAHMEAVRRRLAPDAWLRRSCTTGPTRRRRRSRPHTTRR